GFINLGNMPSATSAELRMLAGAIEAVYIFIFGLPCMQRLAQSGRTRTGEGDLVVLACVGQRLIALEDLADDFNVLAGAQEWLAVSHTVPALHHLWAGRPDTKDKATA